MSPNRKRLAEIAAPLVGILLGALILLPLVDRNISQVTAGVMIGVAGTICLLGVGLGIWNVQRGEARRRAKEDIWLKH